VFYRGLQAPNKVVMHLWIVTRHHKTVPSQLDEAQIISQGGVLTGIFEQGMPG
jgi:ABC-type maltose transport system permease subunit